MTNAEIRQFIERAKSFARARGYDDLADDFAQDAFMRLAAGRKASLEQLLIDFVRTEYGRTRLPGGGMRQSKRARTVSLDAPTKANGGVPLVESLRCPGGDPEPLAHARQLPVALGGRDALIYELHIEQEMPQAEVAEMLGVTESRVSQIVRWRIHRAVESAYLLGEALDLYHDDPGASLLAVDWIKL